ncbi:MAG: vWA domain-containing protein [Burkholderiaceae bacterium]
MKTLLLASGLFVATAMGVVYYDDLVAATRPPVKEAGPTLPTLPTPTPTPTPMPTPVRLPATDPSQSVINAASHSPRIDLVFALDTTGSMSGMINAAKEKIWSIASTMANAQVAPIIRVGLVAYRDRGDAYITRMVDLTDDLDAMYAALMQFQASGGGDGPESVNQALHEAVNKMSWAQEDNTYKVVFLVGDAPPHMDYDNDVPYPETIALANKRGIVINTIQCGTSSPAKRDWQKIASLSQGQYFQVGQSGNAVAIATPYDQPMARLARALDDTRLAYGSRKERAVVEEKRSRVNEVMSAAPAASAARRAAFNASVSGKANLLGDKDLVADVQSGAIDIAAVRKDHLPAELRDLRTDEARAVLQKRAQKRQSIEKEIQQLSAQRQAFIRDQLTTTGSSDSLDDKIFATVRAQAAGKGLRYEAVQPQY